MNKRMIINWLKEEQTKALSAVGNQAEENRKQAYRSLWKVVGMEDAADTIQKAANDLQRMAREFEDKLNNTEGVSLRLYRLLSSQFYTATNSSDAVKRFIPTMIDENSSPIFQKINKHANELKRGVQANYTAAIENVRGMKDAKAAMVYLEGLGFDLTSLKALDEPKETTAIAMPVDTRFLFVGSARK